MKLGVRERVSEFMDSPAADPRLLEGALRTLETLNRLPFGGAAGVRRLTRMIAESGSRRATVLDVGTGGGDLARRLARWGRETATDVRCVGLDLSVSVSRRAKEVASDENVSFVAGDAARLPFADGAFDFVHSSLLVHHLRDEPQVVEFFREAGRVARRGAVMNDLVRTRRAYAIVWVATAFCRNPYVRHDGPASVRNSFRPSELEALARAAGWRSVRIETVLAHRMCVILAKDGAPS